MYYAQQIAPEYQESPLMIFDEWPEDMVFHGNRNYESHTIPVYDDFMDNWRYAWEEVEAIMHGYGGCSFDTVTQAIMHYLKPEHKARYNTREIAEWKAILYDMDYGSPSDENKTICKAMSLITGKEWDCTTIRGCCQGDWQEIIYCADKWNREAIEQVESEYFNLGSEWMIHDGEDAPEDPEDISGYTVYCYKWDEDGIRQEIAFHIGCNPDEVVMYAYDGSVMMPKYKKVG